MARFTLGAMAKKPIFDRIVAVVGTQTALARALGVKPQALTKWKNTDRIPANRVLDVERLTGISRYEMRPDVFGRAA